MIVLQAQMRPSSSTSGGESITPSHRDKRSREMMDHPTDLTPPTSVIEKNYEGHDGAMSYDNEQRRTHTSPRSPPRKKQAVGEEDDALNKAYMDSKFQQLKQHFEELIKENRHESAPGPGRKVAGTQTKSSDTVSKVTETTEWRQAAEKYEDDKKLAKYARSQEELCNHLPHIKSQYASETAKDMNEPDGLYCSTCLPDPKDDIAVAGQTSAPSRFTLGKKGEMK